MWKGSVIVGSKNVVRVSDGLLGRPTCEIVNGAGTRNASSEVPVRYETPEPLRSGLQASYPRGTGGRQSFSGNVCTVFGAPGYIGKYIVNKLGKEGNQVVIPYRADPYYCRHLKTAGDLGQILFFPFNLKDEDSIRKVVRYSNVVINLIGSDFETWHYSFDEVNAHGAGRIARICREMGVKRLIHFSAMNASEHPEEHLIPGGSQFLRSKALGEKLVRDNFPDAMIVRPSDVFGWQDRFFTSYSFMFRRNMLQQMCLYRKGEYAYKAPVHVYNVSQGVMRLLHDPTCDGKTFEFVGPYWYQLGDLIDWLFRVLHRYETEFYMRRHIDAWTSFKVNVQEIKRMISKHQADFDWEKIERTEAISDLLSSDSLTLKDLGIILDALEEKVPPHVKAFDKEAAHRPKMGEWPIPPYPKRLPPMYKNTADRSFNEDFHRPSSIPVVV